MCKQFLGSGFAFALVVAFAGCSSPQAPPTEEVTQAPKEEEPVCFRGCALSSSGACTTEGNVMDWSGSAAETIDCDPRCCQPGANPSFPDADGDGIPDDADQCPNEPEDFDGFEDEDGCPDLDNDGDGIPDEVDVCPLDPEDFDGVQDEDGCPDL